MPAELFQYIFKVGVFDIDDLIIRTLGMMTFYMIYNNKKRQEYLKK